MHLLRLTALFSILWIPGCAGTALPITNGHLSDPPERGSTVVVWGQHKGAVGTTVTLLQQMGYRIVERSRLQQVFDEQKTKMTHSSDDDAQILKVGKLLGAGSIVFVEIESSSSQRSGAAFVSGYGGESRSETVTNASVSVRGVDVESGVVMWTGTAHYPKAINNPEAGIVYLTQSAVQRGLCHPSAWRSDQEGCDWAKGFGGRIGFGGESKTTPEGRQLFITSVEPNSPADESGLKVGDIVLSCNGKSGIQTMGQYWLLCRTEAGQTAILRVKRGDAITTISVTAILLTAVQK